MLIRLSQDAECLTIVGIQKVRHITLSYGVVTDLEPSVDMKSLRAAKGTTSTLVMRHGAANIFESAVFVA